VRPNAPDWPVLPVLPVRPVLPVAVAPFPVRASRACSPLCAGPSTCCPGRARAGSSGDALGRAVAYKGLTGVRDALVAWLRG
jgi:hypothetical protein